MHLRVAPHFASSGSAGVRSSGCPESRLHSARPAVFKFPGFPKTLFRPMRLSMHHGLPRYLHLPALPATDRRVTPTLASFSASVASAASFPAASLFQLRLLTQVPGITPVPASSGYTGNGYSSYPEPLVLRCSRCLSSRFPSRSAPPGCSSRRRFEFPHALRLPAWPQD